VELGKGRKLTDIIEDMHGAVAEGVFTTKAAIGLALSKNVEMPITETDVRDPRKWKTSATGY